MALVSGVTKVGVEMPSKSCVCCSSSSSFGPGHAHELDAHAHEADVVDVGRHVRAGARVANPRLVRAPGLREDAVPHRLRQVVADGDLAADDAVRLRVPSALGVAGVPEPADLGVEARDDVLEMGLLVRLGPFLGDRQALVLSPLVDERRDEPRQGLAENLVGGGAEEGVEAALDADHADQRTADPVEQEVARVGRRKAEAGAWVGASSHRCPRRSASIVVEGARARAPSTSPSTGRP